MSTGGQKNDRPASQGKPLRFGHWKRESNKPVLSAEQKWEKVAVMCPHVIYDDKSRLYRMWYSGGEQHEPNAIGYATGEDGLKWTKREDNPVFRPDPKNSWENERVTGCQVIRQGDWCVMFHIGFRDIEHAQIGIARSKDGITDWQRHSANPIIRAGKDKWDHDAVYKPYAICDGKKWLLWHNGRKGGVEQMRLLGGFRQRRHAANAGDDQEDEFRPARRLGCLACGRSQ